MDVIEAIKTRRSVRAFQSRDVPEDRVEEILELGKWAPSAGNLQSRDFIVIRDPEIKSRLAEAALGQDFITQAPVVIVVCANMKRASPYGGRGRELYCVQDADASIYAVLLAAHSKGLGACWVGAFETEQVVEILKLPNYAVPVAIIPVGYPDEEPEAPPRRPLSDLTHKEMWGGKEYRQV